ncbi:MULTISPECIES: LLM class flavin-dependent oxidoreductase [Microbacterium]|uniref:LLM class flavin-dependent oxidoreductase n=1 Tax=Microbacterium profundi TaxID=450380 RepID=A0ABV3LKC6_9MICO|nr:MULTISPECIES: LLM class flavin-dependent oxidoreductase [Microbacterium]
MSRLATALSSRAPLPQLVEQAKFVEGLGYDRIWLPEISGRDAFVTAAILATQTQTIGVGLGVIPLPSRPLPALEMAVATLAESAPGRVAVGLGAGHRETAAPQFGWRGPASPDKVGEAVFAIRAALETSTLHHYGAGGESCVLKLRGQHIEVPPQLFVGALRPRMVKIAAGIADGMLLNWVTEARAARLCALAGEVARGRMFTTAAYIPVCVVDRPKDRDHAYRKVASQLSSYLQLSAYGDPLADDGYADDVKAVREARRYGRDATAAVSERLIQAVAMIGDADEIRARIRGLRAAGIDEPVLAPVTIGRDSASSLLLTLTALAE